MYQYPYLHHIEEDGYGGIPQVNVRYEGHLEEAAHHAGDEADLVLAQVEPHRLDLQAHLLPHVPVPSPSIFNMCEQVFEPHGIGSSYREKVKYKLYIYILVC